MPRNSTVRYTGDVDEHGLYHGHGQLYNEGKLRYVGAFAAGKFHGKGKWYTDDATLEYEGDFVDGHYCGTGTFSAAGSVACVGCPAGKYLPSQGAASADEVTSGTTVCSRSARARAYSCRPR